MPNDFSDSERPSSTDSEYPQELRTIDQFSSADKAYFDDIKAAAEENRQHRNTEIVERVAKPARDRLSANAFRDQVTQASLQDTVILPRVNKPIPQEFARTPNRTESEPLTDEREIRENYNGALRCFAMHCKQANGAAIPFEENALPNFTLGYQYFEGIFIGSNGELVEVRLHPADFRRYKKIPKRSLPSLTYKGGDEESFKELIKLFSKIRINTTEDLL